jgi:DNA polymerase elongation subunit (family B)
MKTIFHLFDSIAQDPQKEEYTITLFGSSADGTPIRLDVQGFEPFFYVELPNTRNAFEHFKMLLTDKVSSTKGGCSYSAKKTKKKPLYGYTGEEISTLVQLSVKTKRHFYELRKLFLNDKSQPIFRIYQDSDPLKVYDAMLDPMLRFFHMRNIQPCGWVETNTNLEETEEGWVGTCRWDEIGPGTAPMASAPFKTNFWDIEVYSKSGDFPQASKNDPIIQIGNVIVQQGFPTKKHIFVLNSCDPIPGIEVTTAKTEKELLLKWAAYMSEENPDIFVGYNIFGFDDKYVWDRAEMLGITEHSSFQSLNRLSQDDRYNQQMKKVEKFLSSSALGDNYLHMWNCTGRLEIDLYHYVRRLASLPSYKLDSVCSFYMSGKLTTVENNGETYTIKTKQTGDIVPGRFLVLLDETGEAIVEKLKVLSVVPGKSIIVEADTTCEPEDLQEAEKWAVVKDDVPPQEIFRLHADEGSAGRAKVAKYCIQDCDLVYELYKKLDVFNNAMSMANVCSVPVSYIFTRGQGIKIESLIFKECHERNIVVEVLESQSFSDKDSDSEKEAEESYEGAIVLDPVPGFYSESPIGVCDFASLYPSTIISENISHDSLVWVKDFDLKGNFLGYSFGNQAHESKAPPGTRWTDIDFDIWGTKEGDTRKMPEKVKKGIRVCRYAQKPDGSKHTLPDIVAKLLAARKTKRKEAEKETDPFRKALLDAEQLAYKLTANSLYGQLGSGTFKVRLQHLAASTTAYGRKQILFAKAAIEEFYGPEANDPRCVAKVIYGDTDSLFVDFGVKNPETGEKLQGLEAREATIHLTEEAGKFITGALKAPHDFEYDKIFDQFIIFSKKRYVGNKYEESPTDFKQTSMGIVLKRRDNAPILKTIYGGAINILLNERNVEKAASFVTQKTLDMVNGAISLSQLTITKSLSKYKADWVRDDIADLDKKITDLSQKRTLSEESKKELEKLKIQMAKKRVELENAPPYPAHKILADRMQERDPGNAPAVGERLGFVYIAAPPGQVAPKLQGERIETPDYIRAKKLQPDYQYYIEHQLMKPIGQLFGLMVEQIPGYKPLSIPLTETTRETLAIDLLFGSPLKACSNQAKKAFMGMMGGSVSTSQPKTTTPRPSTPVAEQPVSIPKQTTLNTYFIHKMIAQEYKEQKKAAASALKKDKKKKDT